MEVVLEKTPKEVPFWQGESYSALPFIFIPRFLWPDKPSRHIWNLYGRTYGIIGKDDYQTSVGVSYLAEAYMNYGFVGMYTVAFLMGLLIAFVERLSYYFLGGYYYFTFMCFLMPVMTYASDLTSIINSIFVVSAVLIIFRSQFKKMARADDYT
ncbi:O-antigen polysaccharide polymerase Wzy [bacterium]|nr:O-antigen polysaccharide polymerase Wzy [bacterium]